MKKTQKFVGLILGLSLIFTFMITPTVTHAASKNDMLAWNKPNVITIYLNKINKINNQFQADLDTITNLRSQYDGSDEWFEAMDATVSDLDDLVTLTKSLKAPIKFSSFHSEFMKGMNGVQLYANVMHDTVNNDDPSLIASAERYLDEGQIHFDDASEKLRVLLN